MEGLGLGAFLDGVEGLGLGAVLDGVDGLGLDGVDGLGLDGVDGLVLDGVEGTGGKCAFSSSIKSGIISKGALILIKKQFWRLGSECGSAHTCCTFGKFWRGILSLRRSFLR